MNKSLITPEPKSGEMLEPETLKRRAEEIQAETQNIFLFANIVKTELFEGSKTAESNEENINFEQLPLIEQMNKTLYDLREISEIVEKIAQRIK